MLVNNLCTLFVKYFRNKPSYSNLQVLSNSVANALKVWNKPGMESTILFIQKVNKFFDCLNVSSVTEGRRKRNDNLMPYASVDDPRFQVRILSITFSFVLNLKAVKTTGTVFYFFF